MSQQEERKFCPLMFASPELWDWDDKGHTEPFCLREKCALWNETRCAFKARARPELREWEGVRDGDGKHGTS